MKFRIFKLFKHICIFLTISAILFSFLISITIVNADSYSTSEITYYKGYWNKDWNEELHQLTRIPSQSNDAPSITIFVHV